MTSLVLERRDLDFIFRTLQDNCVPAEDKATVIRLWLDRVSLPTPRDNYNPPPNAAENPQSITTGESGINHSASYLPARTQNSRVNYLFSECLVQPDRTLGSAREIASCIQSVNEQIRQTFMAENNVGRPDRICIAEDRGPNPNRLDPCPQAMDENQTPPRPRFPALPADYTPPAAFTPADQQVCRDLQSEHDNANYFRDPYLSPYRRTPAEANQVREQNAGNPHFEVMVPVTVRERNAATYINRTEPFVSQARVTSDEGLYVFFQGYREFLRTRIQDGVRPRTDADITPGNLTTPAPSASVSAEENEAMARIRARPGDGHYGSSTRLVYSWASNPLPYVLPREQRTNIFELGVASNRDFWNYGASLLYAPNFSTGDHNLMLSLNTQWSLANSPIRFFRQFHVRVSAAAGINVGDFELDGFASRGDHLIAGGMVDFTTYSSMGCFIPSLLMMLPRPQEMDRCMRTPQLGVNVPTSSMTFGLGAFYQSDGPPLVVANVSFRNLHDAGWIVDGALMLAGFIFSLTNTGGR